MKVFVALIHTNDTENKPALMAAADREALRQKLHTMLVDCYSPCPLAKDATIAEMSKWFTETDGGLMESSGSYLIVEYEDEI